MGKKVIDMNQSKLERSHSLINVNLKNRRRNKANRNTKASRRTKKNRNSKPSKIKRNNRYTKASAKKRNNYKIKKSRQKNNLSETESNLDSFVPLAEEELQCSEVYEFLNNRFCLKNMLFFS